MLSYRIDENVCVCVCVCSVAECLPEARSMFISEDIS